MEVNRFNDENTEVLTEEEIEARRVEKVQNFKLDLDFDEEIPDYAPVEPAKKEETPITNLSELISPDDEEEVPAPNKKAKKKRHGRWGCLKRIIYILFILCVSAVLSYLLVTFLLDSMAFNREEKVVDLEIPMYSTTEDIAQMLEDNGLIDSAFCFRVFSKLTKADGKWQTGAFTVSPDMGYSTLIETLQTMTPRETVTVTIPEGFTVEEMAKRFEENNVCDSKSFYEAIIYGEYDYDFIHAIPTIDDGDEYAGRIYRLEGYLFPDTYNFYVGSSGETVVGRMLENFNNKMTDEVRSAIRDRGWTIDQAIIIASIIEGEAASKEDMEKVSKVLENRLAPDSGYPKLQLCSTRDYVKNILPSIDGLAVTSIAYNTYEREGLPVGAINNPGMQAIMAALYPSADKEMENCYFFATDYNTGITYFSKSFKEHEAICRKYKIGMYG